MPGLEDLRAIQAETADALLAGDSPAARLLRAKRLDGIARWLPATVARLRGLRWLDAIARDFMASSTSESADPYTDAVAFRDFLESNRFDVDAEDAARLRLLRPGAARFGLAIIAGRVFIRTGPDLREIGRRPPSPTGG